MAVSKKPLTIIKRENDAPLEGEERIFSEENSKNVVAMLEQVVEQKAENAKVDGYRVGGKTGTAFKAVAGGYGNDYVGLFSGVAPVSDPKLVVIVVINEPGRRYVSWR